MQKAKFRSAASSLTSRNIATAKEHSAARELNQRWTKTMKQPVWEQTVFIQVLLSLWSFGDNSEKHNYVLLYMDNNLLYIKIYSCDGQWRLFSDLEVFAETISNWTVSSSFKVTSGKRNVINLLTRRPGGGGEAYAAGWAAAPISSYMGRPSSVHLTIFCGFILSAGPPNIGPV